MEKKAPKWYLAACIFAAILLLLIIGGNFLRGWLFRIPIFLIELTNFILCIYFFAKKYEKKLLILPIAFVIFFIALFAGYYVEEILMILVVLIVGYSLYLWWRE